MRVNNKQKLHGRLVMLPCSLENRNFTPQLLGIGQAYIPSDNTTSPWQQFHPGRYYVFHIPYEESLRVSCNWDIVGTCLNEHTYAKSVGVGGAGGGGGGETAAAAAVLDDNWCMVSCVCLVVYGMGNLKMWQNFCHRVWNYRDSIIFTHTQKTYIHIYVYTHTHLCICTYLLTYPSEFVMGALTVVKSMFYVTLIVHPPPPPQFYHSFWWKWIYICDAFPQSVGLG